MVEVHLEDTSRFISEFILHDEASKGRLSRFITRLNVIQATCRLLVTFMSLKKEGGNMDTGISIVANSILVIEVKKRSENSYL